ncbi:MAG: acylphosphatase [Nitrospirales bacterium]
MEEILGVHVVVRGTVQGVGFRVFVEHQATQRGLHGWVCNKPDGTVELEAEGSRSALEAFLRVLQEGPPLSHVTQMMVDWKAANRHTHGFTIRRGEPEPFPSDD